MTRRALQDELTPVVGSAREARFLVDEVASPTGPLDEPAADRARAMARRRRDGEPLQYVLGTWAFRGLEVRVDERALVPRPETEVVAEVALAELSWVAACRPDAPVSVVDLGTGSGVLALSIAAEGRAPDRDPVVWAVDVDRRALDLASANLDLLAASDRDAARRVHFREGSWWSALPGVLRGRVDLVVSNPPYVSEEEWPALDPEVRREPRLALVAGSGSDGTPGLAAVEEVLRGAPAWLARPGVAVIELAPHQATAAQAMARRAGANVVRIAPDLSGRPRVLVARFDDQGS
jgi:release factor glutamine methyltransferase